MKKAVLLMISATLLAGCSLLPQKQSTTTSQTQNTSATPATNTTMTKENTVEISGGNFSFGQKEIRVKKGDKLTVNFTNKEGFHDFVIDELSVKTAVLPQGQSEAVVIPTDTPGTYAYYCSVGEHRANGMEGKLIIE